MLETRDLAALPNLRELLVVLDPHADGLGVVEHVGVLDRAGRVDRRGDDADRAEGVVEQAPLERRAADDPERIPFFKPSARRPFASSSTAVAGLGPGDLVPVVPVLDQVAFVLPAEAAFCQSAGIVRGPGPLVVLSRVGRSLGCHRVQAYAKESRREGENSWSH